MLVPAVACSVWLGYLAYREHGARLGSTLRSSATVISTYEEELLRDVEDTLTRLLNEPVVAAMQDPACSTYLDDELRRYGKFLTLARIDDNGVARCASIPDLVGVSYVDRRWFAEIGSGRRPFVISEVVLGRVLRRPTVVLALRVPGAAGVLAATMDIRGFTPIGARSSLVGSSNSLVIVDNAGRALIEPREGEPDQSLAVPPREEIVAALADPGSTFESVGLDGVRRLYAIAPVAGGSLNVLLGTPAGGRWEWLQSRAPTILAPIVLLVLAILAIWFATQYLVGRHVEALSRAARRWSQEHSHDWPSLEGAPAELRDLGATFSQMAERIANREDELQASLSQKEVLLKEIHHRVKNNLQIVSSLINLRIRASRGDEVREALVAVQMRIRALTLVHRNLYEQDEPTSIELETFLVELCQLFGESIDENDNVEIHASVQPGRASADRVTPIALLTAECVTNALRHGFPDGRRGSIVVRIDRADGMACLSVSDDGVGWERSSLREGMGLTLCRMLAKQIGGELEISGPPGTTVSVTFPERPGGRPDSPGVAQKEPGAHIRR